MKKKNNDLKSLPLPALLVVALLPVELSFDGVPKLIVGGQVTGSSMGSSTVVLLASTLELVEVFDVDAAEAVVFVESVVFDAEVVVALLVDVAVPVVLLLRDGCWCCRNAAGNIAGVMKLLELT